MTSSREAYCRLRGRPVTVLVGAPVWCCVSCPELDIATGRCRIKDEALKAGVLKTLLIAVGESDLDTTARCRFVDGDCGD